MWSATGRTWKRRKRKPSQVRPPPFPEPTLPKSLTSTLQMTRFLPRTTARRWSGCFAISTPAASVEPLADCSTVQPGNGMPSALGLHKCQPGRQVICLAGDGGFAMLLGDLLTTVQEHLPIKIVVYDNGKLGFVDIEQKAAGLVPVYTDLKNPNFGEVAKAMG